MEEDRVSCQKSPHVMCLSALAENCLVLELLSQLETSTGLNSQSTLKRRFTSDYFLSLVSEVDGAIASHQIQLVTQCHRRESLSTARSLVSCGSHIPAAPSPLAHMLCPG
ncbi:hypothetical protein GN956_G5790 [Arapaima gigas]